jgi:peptide/nickel transport system substrate-binding protein
VTPANTLAKQLLEGTLDLVPNLPKSEHAALEGAANVAVHTAPDEAMLFLQPDLSVPVFADVRTRRALLMALDRTTLAKEYVEGPGRVAHTFRPEDSPEFAPDVARVSYDPTQAKRALKEAASGLKSVKLILADSPAGSGYAMAAERVAKNLQDVGLSVERQVLPSNKVNELFQRGDHGGLLLHSRRERRPARYFNLPSLPGSVLDTRTPRPHYPEKVIDSVRQLESSLFPERRRLLSMRLQRAFSESLPLLPLAFGAQMLGHTKSLQGMQLGPTTSIWWNVETWVVGGGN